MKKSKIFLRRALLPAACAALFAFAPAKAAAIEFVIAGGIGNEGFSSTGEFPRAFFPNAMLGVSGDIRDFLSANIVAEQDSVFGRKIAADISYTAGFLTLKAGPVFGILNGTDGSEQTSGLLLQPGLRLGLSLFFIDRILFEVSSDFCFQLEDTANPQFYPSQSKIGLGVVFPVISCSLEVNQRSAAVTGSAGYTQTRTDYGIYTHVFSKNSPFRMNVNLIYRTLAYESSTLEESNKSLVVGGAVEFRIKMVEIFVNGEGAILTIENTAGGDTLALNATAGVRIMTR